MTDVAPFIKLTSPDGIRTLAIGQVLPRTASVLFSDGNLPSFRLDGTQQLLDELLQSETDVLRLTFSESGEQALASGLAHTFTRADGREQLRDVNTGHFGEVGSLIAAATPFAATPQAMVALLAVSAVSELATHLRRAFERIEGRLERITDMLAAERRRALNGDFASVETAMETASLAEITLREAGRVPSGIDLGGAASDAKRLWRQYRQELVDAEATLNELVAKKSTAHRYVKTLKKAFPFGLDDFTARLVVLAASGIAVMHTHAVQAAQIELEVEGVQQVRQRFQRDTADVRDSLERTITLTKSLARARFSPDRPTKEQKLRWGPLSQDDKALLLHWELMSLHDSVADMLQGADYEGSTPDWVEMELTRRDGHVVAKAIAHNDRSEPLSGDVPRHVDRALSELQ